MGVGRYIGLDAPGVKRPVRRGVGPTGTVLRAGGFATMVITPRPLSHRPPFPPGVLRLTSEPRRQFQTGAAHCLPRTPPDTRTFCLRCAANRSADRSVGRSFVSNRIRALGRSGQPPVADAWPNDAYPHWPSASLAFRFYKTRDVLPSCVPSACVRIGCDLLAGPGGSGKT